MRRALAVGAGMWLLIDLLRVWAPSLITVFGQAASTPAELMGAFALSVIVAGLLPLLVVRFAGVPGHVVLVGCLIGAALSRVALQVVDGGQPQLWWASIGVACAVGWCCLATMWLGDHLLEGYAVGLALAATTHAALGTWGAVWRSDGWAWTLLVAQVALVIAAVPASWHRRPAPTSPRLAFVLLPSCLLAGTWAANPARGSATDETWGPLLVALGVMAAVVMAAVVLGSVVLGSVTTARSGVRSLLAVSAAGLVLSAGTTVVMVPGVAWVWTLPAFVLGMPALVVVLGALGLPTSQSTTVTSASEPVLAAAAGAVLWVVLFFAYYAGYDLGYRADLLLVVVAAGLSALAVHSVVKARVGSVEPEDAGSVTGPLTGPITGRPLTGAVLAGLLGVVAVVLGPSVTVRPVDASEDHHDGLRVLAWNLRMGYGMDGTFEPHAVARLIADEHPDVVLLSEIDRAWMLNGGQDQLSVLARLLGMEAHFGSAADPVWGDAVLTDLPVSAVDAHPLASYDAVTGAQALALTVDLDGTAYDVVSTHVQPHGGDGDGSLEQAHDIAAFVQARAADGNPVVVGGDFNLEPGSPSWNALMDTGLGDALDRARPLFTSPADEPEQQIDHVFVTPGLTPADPHVVPSELSDHLPVVVTVAPRG